MDRGCQATIYVRAMHVLANDRQTSAVCRYPDSVGLVRVTEHVFKNHKIIRTVVHDQNLRHCPEVNIL